MLKLELFCGCEVRLYHEGIKGIFGGKEIKKGVDVLIPTDLPYGFQRPVSSIPRFSRHRRKPSRIQSERSSMHSLEDME